MNEPSLRKPLGVLAIFMWIALWAVLAVTLPRPDNVWLQMLWFGVLGLAWIAPLKPVLRWMEHSSPDSGGGPSPGDGGGAPRP